MATKIHKGHRTRSILHNLTWRTSTAASRPRPPVVRTPDGEDWEVREVDVLNLGLELPGRQHRPARLAPPTGVCRGA